MILPLCMNVIGVSHVKMGTRHCISRLMPHMSTSTTVRKRNLVKMNGPLKNAKSATRTSARKVKIVRTIVRRLVTNVTENKSHADNITQVFLLLSFIFEPTGAFVFIPDFLSKC